MFFDFENAMIREYIRQAEFGIERECLRINSDGTLAQTPHPFESHKNRLPRKLKLSFKIDDATNQI